MRVAVIGAGGVGGYFGGRLAAAGHDVSFLARGVNLAALQRDGLRLRSPRGDLDLRVTATDDPEAVGPCDVVLFTVKAYATEAALPMLRPLLGADGWVASLQNGGVAPAERIAEAIGADRTVGGAAYISCHLRAPGMLEHRPGPARLALGELCGGLSPRLEAFADEAKAADIDVELSADARALLWTKFVLICALAGATAASRQPMGSIRVGTSGQWLLRALVEEAVAVGRAEGVGLLADCVQTTLDTLNNFEKGRVGSLYEDLVNGREMELDSLHGELLRRAVASGVDVPVTRTVYALLEPWARAAADGSSAQTKSSAP